MIGQNSEEIYEGYLEEISGKIHEFFGRIAGIILGERKRDLLTEFFESF